MSRILIEREADRDPTWSRSSVFLIRDERPLSKRLGRVVMVLFIGAILVGAYAWFLRWSWLPGGADHYNLYLSLAAFVVGLPLLWTQLAPGPNWRQGGLTAPVMTIEPEGVVVNGQRFQLHHGSRVRMVRQGDGARVVVDVRGRGAVTLLAALSDKEAQQLAQEICVVCGILPADSPARTN